MRFRVAAPALLHFAHFSTCMPCWFGIHCESEFFEQSSAFTAQLCCDLSSRPSFHRPLPKSFACFRPVQLGACLAVSLACHCSWVQFQNNWGSSATFGFPSHRFDRQRWIGCLGRRTLHAQAASNPFYWPCAPITSDAACLPSAAASRILGACFSEPHFYVSSSCESWIITSVVRDSSDSLATSSQPWPPRLTSSTVSDSHATSLFLPEKKSFSHWWPSCPPVPPCSSYCFCRATSHFTGKPPRRFRNRFRPSREAMTWWQARLPDWWSSTDRILVLIASGNALIWRIGFSNIDFVYFGKIDCSKISKNSK